MIILQRETLFINICIPASGSQVVNVNTKQLLLNPVFDRSHLNQLLITVKFTD